jgi:hypothetical protein
VSLLGIASHTKMLYTLNPSTIHYLGKGMVKLKNALLVLLLDSGNKIYIFTNYSKYIHVYGHGHPVDVGLSYPVCAYQYQLYVSTSNLSTVVFSKLKIDALSNGAEIIYKLLREEW